MHDKCRDYLNELKSILYNQKQKIYEHFKIVCNADSLTFPSVM